ncbi:MAG: hypothetical protein KF772_02330 [Cryobacterium sp.]|nr:hypothetical protein [Cryobacterium sp.]
MTRKHDWPWIIAAIAAASVLAIVLWALFSYLTVWRFNSRTEPNGSSNSGATSEPASQGSFETGSHAYTMHMSNGGILSYTLACESDVFAAIGPTSATMLVDCPEPNPISVIHIHGLLDTSVPFDGSKGGGMASIDGPPIETVISAWRKTDSCAAPSVSTEGVVTTSIAQCADGRAVELITVADAGHSWPGTPPSQGSAPTASAPIESTQVIWQFFASHPKG